MGASSRRATLAVPRHFPQRAGRPGTAPLPAWWVLLPGPAPSSRLSPCSPPAPSRLWGRWVGTLNPAPASLGRVVAPALLADGGPGCLATCLWWRGPAGAVFLSVCSAVGTASHADQGRRPPGSQLSASSEGRERGSCPRAFPTVEGATMPELPGLKRCQAQPTQAQGWAMLVGTQRSLVAPWLGRLPPTSYRCSSSGTPVLRDVAASVLSTSFCASPDESFPLAGHERAFIPSPPRGRITPGRTLCRRLAPGLPVAPARVGTQHGSAGASRREREQTVASLAPHNPYLLLGHLRTDRCRPGRGGTRLWPCLCFWHGYLYLLNKDATVIWAERRPWSSPAPRSPAPPPSAAPPLRPWAARPAPPGAPPAGSALMTACWGAQV